MQHLTSPSSDVCRQYMSALSLVLPYAQCPRTVRVQIAYSALCSHLIGRPIEASHVMEWGCSWNVCGMYVCNEKKGTAKICETFVDEALVQRCRSARTRPSSRVTYRGFFVIEEFRQHDEKWLWDFASEYWPQNPKERYKISRSSSCLNQISLTAQKFSQWRISVLFLFCKKIASAFVLRIL
jgi:hypothetical protein